MPTYGLTSTGFVPKTLTIIREEINDSLRAIFGTSVDLSDGSALGQFVGIFAEREALVWELAEQIAASQDPDGATGTLLEALCALTGTIREAATYSTVDIILLGVASTVVSSGSRAANGQGDEFATTANATLVALSAWLASTAYGVGAIRTNASKLYYCITAGTSAGSGGPTTTAADITDGTVHWMYLCEGTAGVLAPAKAVNTGPILALAGDIREIVTPVSGWNAVYNQLDAALGSDVETDEDLRVRRESELAAAGTTTADALRAALLDVAGVTSVTLFVNDTDTTDADGVPPHAIEALVLGGTDANIRAALFANVAAGVATYGSTSGTVVDSQGTSHTVKFSRPTSVPIWIDVVLTYRSGEYPADGNTQVKTKIVEWGDAFVTGKDVVSSAVLAQVFKVAGVENVTLPEIGTSDPPTTTTTIVITARQLATFDTSRITVVSTPA